MTTDTPGVLTLSAAQMADMLFAATQELFTSMLGAEVRLIGDASADGNEWFDGVFSMIGMTGKVIGTGAVLCTAATACDLSSRFLMTEFEHVDEQVLDAMGEVTNMIIGGFKNLLEEHFGRLHMSIPTVVHGKNIRARNRKTDVAVELRCAYDAGEIRVKMDLAACRE